MNDGQDRRDKQAEINSAGKERQGRRAEQRRWLKRHRLRQIGCCFYCGVKFEPEPLIRATLDHFIPLAKGGDDTFGNTVAACALCNIAKGCLLPDELLLELPKARVRVLDAMDRKRSGRPD